MFLALSRYSTTLHQRRWYTESLDAFEDGSEQLTSDRDFGHPDSIVRNEGAE
jgi:hypothetical protein